jgi:heme/copper-type cytochrome/quinol oxidase subunit 4
MDTLINIGFYFMLCLGVVLFSLVVADLALFSRRWRFRTYALMMVSSFLLVLPYFLNQSDKEGQKEESAPECRCIYGPAPTGETK